MYAFITTNVMNKSAMRVVNSVKADCTGLALAYSFLI